MNIEINYNYKFYLWGIAKPHRLWSMKLHVSSPTSEPPTIVRSNKHGDVMGLSWGYDDSGCGIYIYIYIYIVLVELGQYGSIGGWFTTNKHYTKSLLTSYHGGIHSCWWTPTWFWNTSTNHSGPLQKRHVQWTHQNDQFRVQNSSFKVIEKIHDVRNVGDPR